MSQAASQDGRQPSGFLRLPLELRDKIYFFILGRDPVNMQFLQFLQFEVDSWTRSMWERHEPPGWLHDGFAYDELDHDGLDHDEFDDDELYDYVPKRKTGILSASRQISEEALNVLYGRNVFYLTIYGDAHSRDAHSQILKFGIKNISRIRHLRLIAKPKGSYYRDTMQFDSRIWTPLLTDLNHLCLILHQPLQRANSDYSAPRREADLTKWVACLKSVLGYLAKNVPKTTVVGIDHNDMEETVEVAQICFPSG
jgi:hypothetical protein